MPRTIPWLTDGAVKKEATPQKRTDKHDPDSDDDKTPKASKNAGHLDHEKTDILRSCEYSLPILQLYKTNHPKRVLPPTLSADVHLKSELLPELEQDDAFIT